MIVASVGRPNFRLHPKGGAGNTGIAGKSVNSDIKF